MRVLSADPGSKTRRKLPYQMMGGCADGNVALSNGVRQKLERAAMSAFLFVFLI